MSTISLSVSEKEAKLINEYAKTNNINLSTFIKNLILDKIEDDSKLDEERILNASNRIKTEKAYSHTEVWEKLGI